MLLWHSLHQWQVLAEQWLFQCDRRDWQYGAVRKNEREHNNWEGVERTSYILYHFFHHTLPDLAFKLFCLGQLVQRCQITLQNGTRKTARSYCVVDFDCRLLSFLLYPRSIPIFDGTVRLHQRPNEFVGSYPLHYFRNFTHFLCLGHLQLWY